MAGWTRSFPTWVYNVALIPAGAIALLCSAGAARATRGAARARGPSSPSYASIAHRRAGDRRGLLLPLRHSRVRRRLGEPRYLLPLLPLLGAVLALAVRGAGRRWAPVAGAVLVILFLAHDLFSQLQVIGRYYG